ncbi:hypothetical protein [Pseudomonas sp. R16(2017)]|uniref:hypothetical protein n=1 Tax=Pseudomonas sp. R16(2017) TaxID=1981704 RepID=UPI0015945672|nr:hypothetical protein [Pseudomonas sp. R16(2017)]
MTHAQHTTQAETALLRNASGSATLVNNSCCAAARIIAPSSSTTEGLVPHEKLREAATPNAALTAQNRPPAQPAVGYRHTSFTHETPHVDLSDSLLEAASRHVAARPFTGPRALMRRFGIGLQGARWILVRLEQQGVMRGHWGRRVAASHIHGVSVYSHRIYRVNPQVWSSHLTMEKQGQMGDAK